MINFYISRIQCGIMTLDQVPPLWSIKVREALEKLNLYTEKSELE